MACPYFWPAEQLENGSWVVPPRLPLGDAYAGQCRAAANVFQPDETRLRQFCNPGYGRGACDQFPPGASADAVRFHVAGESETVIRLQYVFEKDCWPVKSGTVECSTAAREVHGAGDAILRGQALAFLESYLKRRDSGE